ncbi:peptide/nickel transport system substrate-binding protein [Amycolatopsis tolypomycina]|uniref:Peptide/nickel transport system substrate-binding protein n=1 Tax=Amycolatopsis tolypomycina TaxID=208445 RepID=A0A1H4TGF1_9PSEU|nr:ABC transporter substrate-binding protein [Amycolatopsis tolypomycina]SEC55447.1 peptide/nickel transport system substrate-binding protein [Amycolatopsis tolypomycina]
MKTCRLLVSCLLASLLSGCFASAGGAGAAPDDGRLRVALAFAPSQNLSPYGQDGYILSRLGVAEGLTRLAADGTAAPALAESWRADDAGRGWVFTVREARFQDGSPVTAAAVVAALTRAAQAKPVPTALGGVQLTAAAVDTRQVRVTTGTPDPVLPLRLSSPALAVFSPKAYERPGAVDLVGTATGPFALTAITGTTAATLDRFDGYWGGRARAAGVDAKFVTDGTARANALRTGQADIVDTLPVAGLASLDERLVQLKATPRNTVLYLNTRSGVFADPGARAAAREAIDTAVLAKNVYEGYAEPGRGIFGPALTWAAGKRVPPEGRAKAMRPAAAAVTIATHGSRPELPEVAQVLQQQLEKAGFTVKLTVLDPARLDSDALAGKFDAVVNSRNVLLETGDPVSVLASDFTCAGGYNLAGICDRRIDDAVAAARPVADPGRRQDAVMAAEAAVLATDAVVPLVHLKVAAGIGPSVQGAVPDPYERAMVGPGTHR